MQFQMALDIRSLPSMEAEITHQINDYAAGYPERKGIPNIWVDYMELPPKVTVKSAEESRRILDVVVKRHFHEHAMQVKAI